MNVQHKSLAEGRWNNLNLCEQLSNVGSEVIRASGWKDKENSEYSMMAADRALELLDLTLSDPKNSKRLKEIVRLREFVADYFYGDNTYNSSPKFWEKYFYAFNYFSRI